MWRYINNPRIVISNNQHIAECDFNIYTGTTNTYGPSSAIINIPNVVSDVRRLYDNHFPSFPFPDPNEDEIYILNVSQIVDGFRITRTGRTPDTYIYPAMIDPVEDKIILPHPVKRMTPLQALSHELGHWFYDRIIDDIVNESAGWYCRDDVTGFDRYTEIAALYCQEEISGLIQNRQSYHITVQRMLEELDFFRGTSDDVISLIIQKLLQR